MSRDGRDVCHVKGVTQDGRDAYRVMGVKVVVPLRGFFGSAGGGIRASMSGPVSRISSTVFTNFSVPQLHGVFPTVQVVTHCSPCDCARRSAFLSFCNFWATFDVLYTLG